MPTTDQPSILYYIHDPMCSWCWGFKQTWTEVQQRLDDRIQVQDLLGGLAADSLAPMPEDMQTRIRDTWHNIEQTIPGTVFNFEFWSQCQPRRSTYPACRAVIAAAQQRETAAKDMVLAIQRAYYVEVKNPSDNDVLIELAADLGLDTQRFATDLDTADTQAELDRQILQAQQLGVYSFPSLVLVTHNAVHDIHIDYTNPDAILEQIEQLLTIND